MSGDKRPHVIIIMADQLRYDALGAHTPHIESLRRDSTEFANAYCASPLCVPARGAFYTGKVPNLTGALHNAKIPQERHKGKVRGNHSNLYRLMEEEWDSWHTGKLDFRTDPPIHLQPDSKTRWYPLEPRYYKFLEQHGKRRPGGDAFRGLVPELAEGRRTRIQRASRPYVGRYEEGLAYFYDGFILNDTLHALRNRDKGRPMLLNAMFFAPHPPFDIPEPWYSRVRQVDLPDNVGRWGRNQSPLQLYNLPGMLGASLSREEWREIWKVYLGFVSLLDDCVGEVIAELKRQEMYDDALIIFTSDHGEMLGSHRLWQKMCMYEESVKTPLFIKFPKGDEPPVKRVAERVGSVDVLPTLCEYLGLPEPDGCSGLSLMPLLEGKALEREAIFIQYDGNGSSSNFSRCVVAGDWKLIVDWFKDEIFLELYHLAEDPHEMNNLAFDPDRSSLVETLLGHLRKHMADTGDEQILPADVYSRFLADYGEFAE